MQSIRRIATKRQYSTNYKNVNDIKSKYSWLLDTSISLALVNTYICDTKEHNRTCIFFGSLIFGPLTTLWLVINMKDAKSIKRDERDKKIEFDHMKNEIALLQSQMNDINPRKSFTGPIIHHPENTVN
jgi:hypothetical protein